MGKSRGSCFRMLSCADGDSASSDELIPPESHASSYKCPWSFRKRFSRHRVLSRNALLEPESVGYNEFSMDSHTNSFKTAKDLYVSEQDTVQMRPSKEEFSVGSALSSSTVNSEVSAICVQNASSNNENFQESAVIIIQTAIRGHLAIRKLKKFKNIIYLQAAVRGHLVRAQAVGTLRCIQAISKIQAIVRDRLACRLHEKLADNEGKSYHYEGRFYATNKLLTNRFAQQLLVSTPSTRTIHIKCDLPKSDSVWIWLERWMAIITENTGEKREQNLSYAGNEDVKSSKLVSNEEKKNGLADTKLDPRSLAPSFESKDDMNSSESNLQSQLDDSLSGGCFNSIEKDKQGQNTNDYSSFKTESKKNNMSITTKMEHTGPLEIEVQKVAMGSRRPRNPAFAAAQSKFKELSGVSKSIKCTSSFSSSNEDYDAKARIVNNHSQLKENKEAGSTVNLQSHDSFIRVASSECGTEISISSTLDTPDRSETECGEIILEIGSGDNHNFSSTTYSNDVFTLANKFNECPRTQTNKIDETVIHESLSSDPLDSSPPTALEVQAHLETTNFQLDKLSIEGTPRSQTAVFEAYGTPSDFSVNAGRSEYKDGNMSTGSSRRLTSRDMSKSVTRGSAEHLSNESKGEKKQRSTVSKIDLDEPRMSNSNSSSVPSYMQATKSARAKVHASISPKSSPDLHDKDDHIKKRLSLPIGNGKQDSSPPKKRSNPSAQQNLKGNAVHDTHASTERRWQR